MTISPTSIRDYARAKGWILSPLGRNDRLYVLENPNHPQRQLVIPMDETVSDYDETVSVIAEKLAYFEGVSLEHVVGNLLEVRDDILRIRIMTERDGFESLPLAFATSAIAATQQLMLSAASTVLYPRRHHPRLSRAEALQFLDAARFQHTEHGSFTLKVSCPFDALDVPGLFGAEEMPFARQTMLTVDNAIRELVSAIEEDVLDEYIENIENAEAPIVSSNLCDALSRMHDEELRNSLEVSVAWSPLRPEPHPQRRDPLRIQRDYFPRIEEVGRALRHTGEAVEDAFVGTVEQLNGDMNEQGHRAGQVILNLLLSEGEVVRAQANLTAEEYEIADRVHMTDGTYVIVLGRLHQGRQPRRLTDIIAFEEIRREPPRLPE